MAFELHHKIEYWPYTLRAKAKVNSQTERLEFQGALIRIDGGVGCLQPWPEFGDLPLDRQLKILARSGMTNLTERVWVACYLDAAARKGNRSEFADFIMPETHSLIPGQGKYLKIKCGRDVASEASRVKELAKNHEKVRLDFNACLEKSQFLDFVKRLDDATVKKIDFVEDAFFGGQHEWDAVQKSIGFDLAADREPLIARVRVEKPAMADVRKLDGRIVFTSNMEHPIGQLFAAREAAAFYSSHPHKTEVCGLASHVVFEPDPFIERLKVENNRLVPPGGTGFGYDDLLAELPWQVLHEGPMPSLQAW